MAAGEFPPAGTRARIACLNRLGIMELRGAIPKPKAGGWRKQAWRMAGFGAFAGEICSPAASSRGRGAGPQLPVRATYPFQMIWMPMQNRMKADNRITTCVPRWPNTATTPLAKRKQT